MELGGNFWPQVGKFKNSLQSLQNYNINLEEDIEEVDNSEQKSENNVINFKAKK